MKGDRIVKFFMPKEERFHDLLDKDTRHLLRSAQAFSEVARATTSASRAEKVAELKHLEHDGDILTGQIFDALNSTFITPLDREDIRSLAMDIDDILDYMEAAAQYMVLFEISDSPEPLRKFADILISMIEEVHRSTGLVWDLSNEKAIQQSIVRISTLENEADTLYASVLADLFRSEGRNPIEVMKWKEIYDSLEEACDACKDFTHVLGNIVVKNA
jgi:predicted phosphate transport protein (TIGR00153 family)